MSKSYLVFVLITLVSITSCNSTDQPTPPASNPAASHAAPENEHLAKVMREQEQSARDAVSKAARPAPPNVRHDNDSQELMAQCIEKTRSDQPNIKDYAARNVDASGGKDILHVQIEWRMAIFYDPTSAPLAVSDCRGIAQKGVVQLTKYAFRTGR